MSSPSLLIKYPLNQSSYPQLSLTKLYLVTMQFSTVFFTLASGLLLLVPGISAIACDPCTFHHPISSLVYCTLQLTCSITVAACNANNKYPAGHSCKYTLNDDCNQNGPIFSGSKSF